MYCNSCTKGSLPLTNSWKNDSKENFDNCARRSTASTSWMGLGNINPNNSLGLNYSFVSRNAPKENFVYPRANYGPYVTIEQTWGEQKQYGC